MAEQLTRYELGIIQKMHDEQGYMCVDRKYLTQQLERIGLSGETSRFEVSQRVKELEGKLIN